MDYFHGRDQKVKGKLSRQLAKNRFLIEEILKDCNDIVKKDFKCGMRRNYKAYILYTDGLTKTEMIEESILRPLLNKDIPDFGRKTDSGKEQRIKESADSEKKPEIKESADFEKEQEMKKPVRERREYGYASETEGLYEYVSKEILEMADLKELTAMEDVVTQVLAGNTVLLLDGCAKGIMISSKMFPTRGVQATDQETAMRGPKDSFTENLRSNTALIRRRIRDSRLKVKQLVAGERSKTDVALMYMEDLVKPEILKQVEHRMRRVSMDVILDSGMLEQLLIKNWKTPFPCMQSTQRPDKTASALLEGRIVLVTDNSPEVLILPASFHTFFQASDDYYNRWEIGSFARLLRYLAAFLAVGFPAFYVAVASFHTEVLPTALILSFAQARQGIPFPVVLEVLLMEMAFELLREAGIRLPGQLGGTIGIVGGLIVGQAAVDAGIVSTIVVIVVALTAIASFSVPNETMASAFRILKFFFILLAAIWGLYGFFLAWLVLIVHLCSLESFGEPYLMPDEWNLRERREKYKDYYLRFPLFTMWKRPVYTREGARIRRRVRIGDKSGNDTKPEEIRGQKSRNDAKTEEIRGQKSGRKGNRYDEE